MEQDYWLFWIDKYSGGYRVGVTHAANHSGKGNTACGIDMASKPIDGGYEKVGGHSELECKKCIKKLATNKNQ